MIFTFPRFKYCSFLKQTDDKEKCFVWKQKNDPTTATEVWEFLFLDKNETGDAMLFDSFKGLAKASGANEAMTVLESPETNKYWIGLKAGMTMFKSESGEGDSASGDHVSLQIKRDRGSKGNQIHSQVSHLFNLLECKDVEYGVMFGSNPMSTEGGPLTATYSYECRDHCKANTGKIQDTNRNIILN